MNYSSDVSTTIVAALIDSTIIIAEVISRFIIEWAAESILNLLLFVCRSISELAILNTFNTLLYEFYFFIYLHFLSLHHFIHFLFHPLAFDSYRIILFHHFSLFFRSLPNNYCFNLFDSIHNIFIAISLYIF